MTRKLQLLIVAGIATGLLATAPAAGAGTITVNTADDDGTLGDCELREAITMANNDPNSDGCTGGGGGTDTIAFDGAVFNEEAADTILIATDLPVITEQLTVNGCSMTALPTDPCVAIDRTGAGLPTALTVRADNSTVTGLAFGIVNGVRVADSINVGENTEGVTLTNSWFGLELDGDDRSSVQTSLQLDTGANNSIIGGDSAGTPPNRNVFYAGGAIIRGDNNQVRGNYFGVKADGATLAVNPPAAAQIEVSALSGQNAPTGNAIGATIDSGVANVCDDACNVIAGGTSRGIDLHGDGAEVPAGQTTIAGNHIGLDVSGSLDRGNGGDGIFVGAADNVTVGGATATDRNSIGGNGSEGIESGAGSTGLAVSNNFIGLNSAGNAAIPDTSRGVDIAGGTFSTNRLGGDTMNPQNGGLRVTTGAATVTGNVFGVGVGGQDLGLPARAIAVESGGMATIGGTNPGDPNVIGNTRGASSNGIELGTDANTVIGNYIGTDSMNSVLTNDGRGLIIYAGINNQIGGLTGASENVFSNNTNAAIEMITDGTDMNRVFRNFGSNNGLFLDLAFNNATGQGPGNPANGPNEGIQAPTITAVNSQTISGTAGPSAVVRIYRTNTANGVAPTDIIAFAGVTTADGGGNWSLTFPAELPVPGQVTANQTNPAGSSSEFTNAMSYLAAPPPPTQTPTPTPLTPVATAPDNSAECAALRAKLKKAKSKRKKRKIRAQLRKLGC